ncbi:hypothetical protein [Terricaulis sp.]|uniref:hypothetical protein n=1 Tax=Terricaulis sp. TaxID=2768686 RepID=UPI0037832C8C
MRTLLAAAAFVSVFAGNALAAPIGCANAPAAPNAPILGTWTVRYRDDGADWNTGNIAQTFLSNGTWTENGRSAGRWCMLDDLVLWSWDEDPFATFRATYNANNPDVLTGTESWNGAGTGIIELTRQSGGDSRK